MLTRSDLQPPLECWGRQQEAQAGGGVTELAGAGHRHGDRPSRVQSSLLLVCMMMMMMMMIRWLI